jgi:ATP-dependent DNA helicase RecG
MTATPIPRTLAMTSFADLDHSVLDELPPGRKPVQTRLINQQRRDELMTRLSTWIAQGHQAYWVCTLVEDSEVIQAEAAEATFDRLRAALPDIRFGLVHGRMKPDERNPCMQAFARGELDVLVATTVIEVGVNVPNASLMVIENAERLGLAQLHQLRGRVGRGTQQSHCLLLYQPPLSENGKTRLECLRSTTDGFRVAELDLELRGPGEVLGSRQTGAQDFRVADLEQDADLVDHAARLGPVFISDTQLTDTLITRWLGARQTLAEV